MLGARRRARQRDEEREAAWEQHTLDPNFFREVAIARDGGFSDVHMLSGRVRYIYGIMSLAFMVMNVYCMLAEHPRTLLHNRWWEDRQSQQEFLLCNVVLHTLFPWLKLEFKPVVLVALFELFLLASIAVKSVLLLWAATCGRRSPTTGWHAVAELFWSVLSQLSTVSAMRLLNFVTPAVLTADLGACLHGMRHPSELLLLLLGRLACAFVGIDAFLLKLQHVSGVLRTDVDETFKLITAVVFLNQLLGIVQLQMFVQRRIESFIFAGEDGVLSKEERVSMDVWHAMLAKQMWQSLNPFQFLAVMLSYSDYDFQTLVLNSVAKPPPRRGGQERELELTLRPEASEV